MDVNSVSSEFLLELNETVGMRCGTTKLKVHTFTYAWTIEDFSIWYNEIEKMGRCLRSPTFSYVADEDPIWYLKLERSHKENTSLYLMLVNGLEEFAVGVEFKCSILNLRREIRRFFESERYHYVFDNWPRGLIICNDILLNNENDSLLEGKLTILCEIREKKYVNIPGQAKIDYKMIESKLTKDLGNLLGNEKFSDVTIAVGKHEFKANKVILAARSEVFAAMFDHEMEENQLNRVNIIDFDCEVIKEMLEFIYTGKTPNLGKMIHELFKAADKYALIDLKVLCEEALRMNISVKTVVETIKLADLHKVESLKARAIDFIKTHINDVMKTQAWQAMITTHPDLTVEVLRSFANQ